MLWARESHSQRFIVMIAFMFATGSKPLLKGAWLLPLHESFASLHPNNHGYSGYSGYYLCHLCNSRELLEQVKHNKS